VTDGLKQADSFPKLYINADDISRVELGGVEGRPSLLWPGIPGSGIQNLTAVASYVDGREVYRVADSTVGHR
jgi:hypothetical protein